MQQGEGLQQRDVAIPNPSNIAHALEEAKRLVEARRFPEAEALCREIYAAAPNHTGVLHALAQLGMHGGRPDIAVELIGRVVKLQPGNVLAHMDLGAALMACGRFDDAAKAYQGAIGARPEHAEAHANLGMALGLRGRFAESVGALQRAIELQPGLVEAHDALGVSLRFLRRADEAVAAHLRATELRPGFATGYSNLGLTFVELGQMPEAAEAFRRAIQLAPDYREAHTNLLHAMHATASDDPASVFAEHRAWYHRHAERLGKGAQPHPNKRDPNRRLRVGYMSADFRQHSVAYFIEGILSGHDAKQVDVYCYSDVPKADGMTRQLQKLTANWRDVAGRRDEEVEALVRRDHIDLLIDLAGHTGGNRLGVFARKAAPVQISYLGYIATTGLGTIDYRITDRFVDPPGVTERWHSEQLLWLPETFACYAPPAEAPMEGPLPAKRHGYVTFASFTTLAKINTALLQCWADVLERVAESRLMIVAKGLGYGSVQRRIRGAFEKRGIATDRVQLREQLPLAEYLAAHQDADILLDTFPVNGHTVLCHGLWMGLPVVSLAGLTYAQRLGASVLMNLGLSEWIAQTREQYVDIAAALAADVPRLAGFRETLRRRMAGSVLMDPARFSSHLEAAYRKAWADWCERP